MLKFHVITFCVKYIFVCEQAIQNYSSNEHFSTKKILNALWLTQAQLKGVIYSWSP